MFFPFTLQNADIRQCQNEIDHIPRFGTQRSVVEHQNKTQNAHDDAHLIEEHISAPLPVIQERVNKYKNEKQGKKRESNVPGFQEHKGDREHRIVNVDMLICKIRIEKIDGRDLAISKSHTKELLPERDEKAIANSGNCRKTADVLLVCIIFAEELVEQGFKG